MGGSVGIWDKENEDTKNGLLTRTEGGVVRWKSWWPAAGWWEDYKGYMQMAWPSLRTKTFVTASFVEKYLVAYEVTSPAENDSILIVKGMQEARLLEATRRDVTKKEHHGNETPGTFPWMMDLRKDDACKVGARSSHPSMTKRHFFPLLLNDGLGYSPAYFSTGMRNEIFKWCCRLYIWVSQGEVNDKFKLLEHVSLGPLLTGIPTDGGLSWACHTFKKNFNRLVVLLTKWNDLSESNFPFLTPHFDCS